jgi:ribosome-associated protein
MNVLPVNETTSIPMDEIRWRFSRSSGPGGQNVNKVSTRVSLIFDVPNSRTLSENQIDLLMKNLANHIGKDGTLQIHVDEERSQSRNREIALERFAEMIAQALIPPKKRTKTRVPKRAKEARILLKKTRSCLKKTRRSPRDWE